MNHSLFIADWSDQEWCEIWDVRGDRRSVSQLNLLCRLRRPDDQKPLPVSTTPLNLTFWLSSPLHTSPTHQSAIHSSQLIDIATRRPGPDNRELYAWFSCWNTQPCRNVIKMIMTVQCWYGYTQVNDLQHSARQILETVYTSSGTISHRYIVILIQSFHWSSCVDLVR